MEKEKEASFFVLSSSENPLILPNNYRIIYYKSGIRQFSPQIIAHSEIDQKLARHCHCYQEEKISELVGVTPMTGPERNWTE